MRFLLSLTAGLILVTAAPAVAADAATGAATASSAATAGQPAKAEFGAAPASATKLDGRPFFTYDASPGGSIEDHIAIINFATKSLKLNVYTVDATNGVNGAFAYAPEAAPRKQVGAWLKVGGSTAQQVTIPARKTVILPVFLHVPANASPGDHAGAVIVSVTGLVQGKNQKLKLEQRIATRAIIRVSGKLRPQLSIDKLHASYAGHLDPFATGVISVTYTVHNTGNVLLGASQQVTVRGLFGSTAHATGLHTIPLLLPGGSYQVRTQVPGILPEVLVTASVRLGPEGLRGDINPGVHASTASVTVWTVPWILLAIVIALLIFVIARNWRRLIRAPKAGPPSVKKSPEGVKS
jgi:Bacterial protein of unknown function (DUF916)